MTSPKVPYTIDSNRYLGAGIVNSKRLLPIPCCRVYGMGNTSVVDAYFLLSLLP